MSDLIPVSEVHPLDGGACPGPGGSLWPCALPAFHGGDHEPPPGYLTKDESDLLAGVRRLREERDELLAALKAMHEAFWGTSHNATEDDANALARAAIAKASR